jgi:hypothetical protein
MKKLLLTMFIVLTLTFTSMSAIYAEESQKIESSAQIKIGEKADFPSLKLKENTYVLDIQKGDITGDKVKDTVVLVGTKEPGEPFCRELGMIIENGKTNKLKFLSNFYSGYDSSKIFLGDFSKDKVSDIFVSIPNGGSGGTYSYGIWTDKNDVLRTISKIEKLSCGAQFEGKFLDNYKVEIKNLDTNKTIILDISGRKNFYSGLELYDENGKLLVERTISFDGYGELKPIDYDGDNTYELEGIQRIWGVAHVDTISEAKTLWKYKYGKFTLKNIELSTIMYESYE